MYQRIQGACGYKYALKAGVTSCFLSIQAWEAPAHVRGPIIIDCYPE